MTDDKEIEQQLGLGRTVNAYQMDVVETVAGLQRVSNLSLEECRAMAYLIVGESIPEDDTRATLHSLSPQLPHAEPQGLRMLDGNLHPPVSYGQNGEKNPKPFAPLET